MAKKKKKKTFFWSKLMGPNLLFLEITHTQNIFLKTKPKTPQFPHKNQNMSDFNTCFLFLYIIQTYESSYKLKSKRK